MLVMEGMKTIREKVEFCVILDKPTPILQGIRMVGTNEVD